jgi:tRNA threonylcarbamoyladenosine biosynthesis protein TsaE
VSVITHSAAETEALGARLAEQLSPGDVIIVSGDIGAGKTTLIRGACRALGIESPVTSPTFTIGHRYEGGRWPVSHLDLYRLDGLDAEDPALLDDYLSSDTISFVEWPAVATPQLKGRRTLPVGLSHAGGERREVDLPTASVRR